jgi:rhodanese-related sulfurtransferase
MKLSFLAVALLAGLALPLCAAGDAPAEPSKDKTPAKAANALNVKNVDVDEAEKLIKDTPGLIVVDVRTPEEYNHQHIKGAINVNVFDQDFDAQIAKLDQTKPILVHCAAGSRSRTACGQMQGKVKFPVIYHMNAGFSAWLKAKKPIEEKPLPSPDRRGLPGQPKPAEKPAEKPAAK